MKVVGGIARFDLKDEADVAALIANGLLWKGGPKAERIGLSYLIHHPDAVNDMVPANIRAMLDGTDRGTVQPDSGPGSDAGPTPPPDVVAPAQPEPETPAEDAGEPAEEPSAPTPEAPPAP